MNTKQVTISKYVAFLNSFVEDEKLPYGQRETLTNKCKRFKISTAAITHCISLGLLKKIQRGVYQPVKSVYHPIDARKLIEESNQKLRSISLKKAATAEIKTIQPKIVKKPKEDFKTKSVRSVSFKPTPLRVFSLFWGLIKFNY